MTEDIKEVLLSQEEISDIVKRLGKEISEDYKDKNLVKKLIYAPPATINEREFERYLKLFHKDASEKISVLQEQMRELNDKYHKVLEEKDKEINFFKKKTIRLQAMLEKMSDRSAV